MKRSTPSRPTFWRAASPLILTTGYDKEGLVAQFRHLPWLQKPFKDQVLEKMAEMTFRRP